MNPGPRQVRATASRAVQGLLCTLAILGSSLAFGAPARASTGGPDAYGYVWVDSKAPSPTVQFSWVNIVSSGIRLTLPDDGCTFEVNLGFQFRYYGTISNEIFVCSNGFITFGVPDSFYADGMIPSLDPPNSRIVGLGINLNPGAGGGIYVRSEVTASPKRFVVSWEGVYKAGGSQPETFQIILEQNATGRDGRIRIQYQTLNGISGMPLVGIENRTGSSGLAYPGPLANNLAVAFLPPSDAGLPPDTLRVVSSRLAPPTVAQGSSNVPMARVDMSTLTNEIFVTAVIVRLSGLNAGPEDVPRARLWLDNGDGTFVPEQDTVLGSGPFGGVPSLARIELPSSLRVAVSSPRATYITYDISPTAGVGDWIGARLSNSSAVTVIFPDIVSGTGFPFDSHVANSYTRIDASQDTLVLASSVSLGNGTAAQWDTDLPAMVLRLDADRNFVDIAGIRVALGGTAATPDVWAVKVLQDNNGDLAFTPGVDNLLAFARPAGGPPAADLAFSLTVFAGSPQSLLIAIDVGPFAQVGNVLNLTVHATDVSLAGGTDRVGTTNFPAASGDLTIVSGARPTLRLPWRDIPRADGIWMMAEYLLGPESTAILARPAGNLVTGYLTAENDANRLYLAVDAPFDDVVDPQDGIALGFDTDGNGLPTAGEDDVFVVNATGAARLTYSALLGGWTFADPCGATGNASLPACAAGLGVTPFRSVAHRFYEFEIPLSLIGIGGPIVPGTSVRFALAAWPHLGLVDGVLRSTWPLVFDAPAALTDYGDLLLAPSVFPNRPPVLLWTGEPGYSGDGVDPDVGLSNETFEWRVAYLDADNDAPRLGEPLLYLTRSGSPVPGSPFTMTPAEPRDANYRDGKVYRHALIELDCGGTYTYSIWVTDARGLWNSTTTLSGPIVVCPDEPPRLVDEKVVPLVAVVGSTFVYEVTYSDPEGRSPSMINVALRLDGVEIASLSPGVSRFVGPDGDFAVGAIFSASVALLVASFNYTFQFHASDLNTTVSSPETFGPYVLAPPPDPLVVAFVDWAPLIVDEGERNVRFLQLILAPILGEVGVTRLVVHRTGTAGDGAVESVSLVHDLDQTGTVTAQDEYLGTEPLLLATATFSFDLSVSVPEFLLILANLTEPGMEPGIADKTVGFQLSDRSDVTVGPGDTVQPFAPFSSTPALINVAPQAVPPSVEGQPAGSDAIRHIIPDAPLFAWGFVDANGLDVEQVRFNLSVEAVPSGAVVWSRTNEIGPTTTLRYAGLPLIDGASYTVSISVSDGRLWSSEQSVVFRMNTAPPAPPLFAPTDGASSLDPNATLVWQPVADLDGDPILYRFWVATDVGFTAPQTGLTSTPGISLSLAAGTTYYWKVGASDGYEFAGNASVWRFSTVGGGGPGVRGEIFGRVLNGTTPLQGALIELLVDDEPVVAAFAAANGTFRFTNLDLQAYVVRIGAFGFQTRTLDAEPQMTSPAVDLGDVALTPFVPGDGGGNDGGDNRSPDGLPSWVFVVVGILAAALLVSYALLGVSLFRRSRRPAETSAEEGVEETAAEFECPECGRTVAATAKGCECGAVFAE